VIHGYLPAGDDGFRFDYRLLEAAVKQVVKAKLCDEDAAMFDGRQGSEKCPTFVVASSAIAIDGPPQLLRSYDSGGFNVTSKCSIWEAAMATTALPLFLKAVNIELAHQSQQFVGGGLAYRNPAELAPDEAYCLWPGASLNLISIGTGKQSPVQLVREDDPTRQRALWMPRLPGLDQMRNRLLGLSAIRQIRDVHARLSDNSEQVHRRMIQWSSLSNNGYYRFNVEEGLERIDIIEWRRMKEIVEQTLRYLEKRDVIKTIKLCTGDIGG